MIELLSARTPNGFKVSITLEELQIPYQIKTINLRENVQKEEWFLKLNPNGRIPVIIDHSNNGFAVFESGAILLYLAEKTGKLIPKNYEEKSEVIQWLFFQMSAVGPMMGQANVFYRYFPENIPAAISRYQNESRRLLEVLDFRLGQSEWLGSKYSIADIANWPWVRQYDWSGISIEGLSNLQRWDKQMSNRPACQKGIDLPESSDAPRKIDKGIKVKNSTVTT